MIISGDIFSSRIVEILIAHLTDIELFSPDFLRWDKHETYNFKPRYTYTFHIILITTLFDWIYTNNYIAFCLPRTFEKYNNLVIRFWYKANKHNTYIILFVTHMVLMLAMDTQAQHAYIRPGTITITPPETTPWEDPPKMLTKLFSLHNNRHGEQDSIFQNFDN